MKTIQEQLTELLLQCQPRKVDAIVLLAGDRFHRTAKVADLYHAGCAPHVVVTSCAHDYAYGSLPSHVLVRKLHSHGIPETDILWEETAAHTRGEAESTIRLAAENGWNSLILVTTEYHQNRAFLTFLKTMQEVNMKLELLMIPEKSFPQFHAKTREEVVAGELERIAAYQQKGHVASWDDGIAFLQKNSVLG